MKLTIYYVQFFYVFLGPQMLLTESLVVVRSNEKLNKFPTDIPSGVVELDLSSNALTDTEADNFKAFYQLQTLRYVL
jgi:hypothetical protein